MGGSARVDAVRPENLVGIFESERENREKDEGERKFAFIQNRVANYTCAGKFLRPTLYQVVICESNLR